MAYDYFTQPQGPAVNVSLFQDAAESGIRQGKASPSGFTSAVQGIKEGVEFGQQVQANAQNAEIKQHAIDQFPQRDAAQAVQDERQKLALQTEQLQAEAQQKNKDSILLASNLKAQAEAVKAQEQLDDLANTKAISDIIGTNDKASITKALQDPKIKGTLIRNPDLATKLLGDARVTLGENDPIFKSASASYDAIEQAKFRQKQYEAELARKAQYAAANEEDFRKASISLEAIPDLEDIKSKEDFDPRKLRVVNANEYEDPQNGQIPATGDVLNRNKFPAKENTDYHILYGNQILETGSRDQKADRQKEVKAYILGNVARGTIPKAQAKAEETSSSSTTQNTPVDGFGNPAATPNISPQAAADINANIVQQERARREQARATAEARGNGQTFSNIEARAAAKVKQQTANYATTPQSVPTPVNTPAVTQAVPPPTVTPNVSVGSPEKADVHLSALMGNPDVQVNIPVEPKYHISNATFERISSSPAFEDKSALVKAIGSIESRGIVNAVSPAGAKGLMQLTAGAAKDVGLDQKDIFNPEKNVNAGENYYNSQEDLIANAYEKYLKRHQIQVGIAYGDQGINIDPDPRVVLAAYNGGAKYVTNAIAAGHLDWESIQNYIKTQKAPKAIEENLSYPNKVLLAAVPFMKGGNASDDALIRQMIRYDMIKVPNIESV